MILCRAPHLDVPWLVASPAPANEDPEASVAVRAVQGADRTDFRDPFLELLSMFQGFLFVFELFACLLCFICCFFFF